MLSVVYGPPTVQSRCQYRDPGFRAVQVTGLVQMDAALCTDSLQRWLYPLPAHFHFVGKAWPQLMTRELSCAQKGQGKDPWGLVRARNLGPGEKS